MSQMSDSRFAALASVGGAGLYALLVYKQLVPGSKGFMLSYDGIVIGALLSIGLIAWLISIDWSQPEETDGEDAPQDNENTPDH